MNITKIRSQFPALSREVSGLPLAYLDGPAGTQVPQSVIDAMVDYYRTSNANTHGFFAGSLETDEMLQQTRQGVATFLNASDAACISFGANMTSLNFSLSRAILRVLSKGDEILITQLDHEANRGPWLSLEEHGMVVKEVLVAKDGTLDYDDFRMKVTPRTKLICLGMASNIFGTVNDIALARKLADEVGARLLLDAVHYAPHFSIDVQAIDCDFLLCSAYKFYGPHVGILYSKPGLLQTLPTDFLRTQSDQAPYRIETGTLNHAAIAGVKAALAFLIDLGSGTSDRQRVVDAMMKIGKHEQALARRLANGLAQIAGCKIWGPSMEVENRTPTIAFTCTGLHPDLVCQQLAKNAINGWSGHFYALRAVERLDLMRQGGVTRLGVVAYNTEDEIDRTLSAVREMVSVKGLA